MHERGTVGAPPRGRRDRLAVFAGKLSRVARVSGEFSLDFSEWSRPLLTGSATQTEFGLTYRKQTTERFLTGARTHISDFSICCFPAPFFTPDSFDDRPKHDHMNFEQDFFSD